MKAPTLLLFAAMLLSPAIIAQSNNETYRFQALAFAGNSFNAGRAFVPQHYITPYFRQTYYNASEQPARCRGGSVMVFPTFIRWKRFCITAGVGFMELNTAIEADSLVSESPIAQIPRTVQMNWRGEISERFVQFPLLIRTWLFHHQRFVFHADAGIVFSALLSGNYLNGMPDAYKQSFVGSSFYTASFNSSYRIFSNRKIGLFLTAGITSQVAVSPTELSRRPGWWGGLLALRVDAY
ncbi:MAG: hypothetical protein IM638_03050 [Bacteroidetes bacterium]|nr:hypothetical protein [Bacteroidota bacterium]